MLSAAMRLEKQGDGRYQVLLGQDRAGMVLGGRRRWIGESRDGEVLGAWSTRAQAVHAVLDDAQDPLWMQMIEAARAIQSSMLCADLTIDRHTLRAWRGKTDFLWILTDTGSHTLALSPPYRNQELLGRYLDPAVRKIRAYLVPATTPQGQIARLSTSQMRRLAQ